MKEPFRFHKKGTPTPQWSTSSSFKEEQRVVVGQKFNTNKNPKRSFVEYVFGFAGRDPKKEHTFGGNVFKNGPIITFFKPNYQLLHSAEGKPNSKPFKAKHNVQTPHRQLENNFEKSPQNDFFHIQNRTNMPLRRSNFDRKTQFCGLFICLLELKMYQKVGLYWPKAML